MNFGNIIEHSLRNLSKISYVFIEQQQLKDSLEIRHNGPLCNVLETGLYKTGFIFNYIASSAAKGEHSDESYYHV